MGNLHSGYFLGVLEFLSDFETFLEKLLEHYGEISSGSKITYEEYIFWYVKKVLEQIINKVKEFKYFSIFIDSTPDISHKDQLSFAICYLIAYGIVLEWFLCFCQILDTYLRKQ